MHECASIKQCWDKLLLAPKGTATQASDVLKETKVVYNNKTTRQQLFVERLLLLLVQTFGCQHEAAQDSTTYVNRTSETIHIIEVTLRVTVKKRGKEKAEKPTSSMHYPTDMRAFAPSSLFTLMNAITRDDASEQTFVSISAGGQGFPMVCRASRGPQAWHHSCDTLPSSG